MGTRKRKKTIDLFVQKMEQEERREPRRRASRPSGSPTLPCRRRRRQNPNNRRPVQQDPSDRHRPHDCPCASPSPGCGPKRPVIRDEHARWQREARTTPRSRIKMRLGEMASRESQVERLDLLLFSRIVGQLRERNEAGVCTRDHCVCPAGMWRGQS